MLFHSLIKESNKQGLKLDASPSFFPFISKYNPFFQKRIQIFISCLQRKDKTWEYSVNIRVYKAINFCFTSLFDTDFFESVVSINTSLNVIKYKPLYYNTLNKFCMSNDLQCAKKGHNLRKFGVEKATSGAFYVAK